MKIKMILRDGTILEGNRSISDQFSEGSQTYQLRVADASPENKEAIGNTVIVPVSAIQFVIKKK